MAEPPNNIDNNKKQSKTSKILKIFNEERIVLGVVLEPETPDLQNDIFTKEDISNAAHEYMVNSRLIGFRHKEEAIDVFLVESYICREGQYIENDYIKPGSWVVALKIVNDALWAMVLSGEINAFSIGGWGDRTPVDDGIVTQNNGGV